MTCFALGAKCVSACFAAAAPRAEPPSAAAPIRSVPSKDASAPQPTACAPRLKKCRRVSSFLYSSKRFIGCPPFLVLFIQNFIHIQHLVRQHGPRGEGGGVKRRIGLRLADGDERLRVGRMGLVEGEEVGKRGV